MTDLEGREFLLHCRYNEVAEAQHLIHSRPSLLAYTDENGNTALHMASGNGNLQILKMYTNI
jgi:ankyrin repeat protein